MKILIIRFSSIGDIVLTTPVVRCLKNQLPGCEIHYLTKAGYEPVLRGNPYIDHFHFLDGNFRRILKTLRGQQFDHIIDLHGNLRSFRVKLGLHFKPRIHTFHKLNFEKWLLVNFKKNLLPKVHVVNRYMQTVKELGVIYDDLGPDFFISESDETVFLNILPPEFGNRYVCLVPGAKFATKSIPASKAAEIVKLINRPVVIAGGLAEEKLAQEIIALSGHKNIVNLCGKLNLPMSAAAVKHAHAVITADTGLMHIATAFNKKIISVWGSTVPELGMYPFLSPEKSVMAEVKNLRCRPCSKIGFAKCPKGHFLCMMNQQASEIAAQAN
jgi:ADP-heptose:LPS heptosyltransferase